MTTDDTRWMLGLTAALLLLAGVVTLAVDAVPVGVGLPFALLFFAVGVGMGLGVLVSRSREANEKKL